MPTILITGGHKGVGRAAVEYLAAQRFEPNGHRILVAGRDMPAVRAVAATVRATAGPLDALLLNAGIQLGKARPRSADGHEMTFATNVLGPFLMANLLLDAMAPLGRIVFTASGTHDPATMDGKVAGRAAAPDAAALARGEADGAALPGARRYTTSKLCDILLAYELDRRLKAAGSRIAALAFDPGFIPETGMMASAPAPLRATMRTRPAKALLQRLGVTTGGLPFSGESLARLAIDPAFADAGGTYWQANAGRLSARRSSAASYDEPAARALWEGCAALAGLGMGEAPGILARAA